MLFTLDVATKSMEQESLDMGIVSVLEALDHARVPHSSQPRASQFLHQQKETWDRLVEEVQLHREVTTQLVAAQQRVAELTPHAKKVDSLRYDEEAAQVRKEQDELLQKDTETRQWILNLLVEVEKERELKLGAEEKLTALEKRESLDAVAVARLRKKRGEILQTTEKLRSKCGVAHEERDQAIRECDQACLERDDLQQRVNSL
ncbi:uncharacterized protein [Miscanthus floridulus]|uniref:uncharacterized protein n=1 Tax=Miscanthus floridulus TaxID=154761 RepID=UPI003457957B